MSAPMEVKCDNGKENVENNFITEKNVRVRNDYGKTPSERTKVHNPKMAICREMTLATLNVAVKDSLVTPCCIETLATSGLAALQWKKYLQADVHVTATVVEQIDRLKENCVLNNINVKPFHLDFNRTPGTPFPDQEASEIQVCQCRANVLLHMEAFDFIYLDPHKSCTSYIDAAFVNLRHLGILCLVVPDISMFARSHHVVDRYYSASVIKTDYIKELAARVIIGQLARSASRCNKGIEVLYTMSVDDFILLGVKVHRGPHIADASNEKLQHLIHCRICEERVLLPKQKAPIENPYSYLPCSCVSENPGKTGVILGPVWSGPIFNPDFLTRMKRNSGGLELVNKTVLMLDCMLEETGCSVTTEEDNSDSNVMDNSHATDCETNSVNFLNEKCESVNPEDNLEKQEDDTTSGHKRQNDNCDTLPVKRLKHVNLENQKETDLWSHSFLPFYYNTHRWKIKNITKIPKVSSLVQLLKSDGYLATKTHFHPRCLRTNANLKQIKETLNKHCHVKH